MREIVLNLAFLLITCFFISKSVDAQSINTDKDRIKIIQKSSNKKTLISGKKMDVRKNNLQHLSPSTVTVLPKDSKNSVVKVKKEKAVKGPKILKYGNREEVNIKAGEDE